MLTAVHAIPPRSWRGVALAAAQGPVLHGARGAQLPGAKLFSCAEAMDEIAKHLRQMAQRCSRLRGTNVMWGSTWMRLYQSSMVAWDERSRIAATLSMAGCRWTNGQPLLDGSHQGGNVGRFDQDLIGLEDDRAGGRVHGGIRAEQHGDGFRVGMAHGADHGEAVAGAGHVQVAEQRVEPMGGDLGQRLGDGGAVVTSKSFSVRMSERVMRMTSSSSTTRIRAIAIAAS